MQKERCGLVESNSTTLSWTDIKLFNNVMLLALVVLHVEFPIFIIIRSVLFRNRS